MFHDHSSEFLRCIRQTAGTHAVILTLAFAGGCASRANVASDPTDAAILRDGQRLLARRSPVSGDATAGIVAGNPMAASPDDTLEKEHR
jgi:hypothetical protein